MRMNEQFQYMKLKMATPMDSAPIVVAPSLPATRPAMKVDAMPIRGTVMFETMLGIAMRNISLFMSFLGFNAQRYTIFCDMSLFLWHRC
jgi:hypothetical protein